MVLASIILRSCWSKKLLEVKGMFTTVREIIEGSLKNLAFNQYIMLRQFLCFDGRVSCLHDSKVPFTTLEDTLIVTTVINSECEGVSRNCRLSTE